MLVLKGLRYRAYPTDAQWAFLRHCAGCTRLTYNLALEQRRTFGRRGRNIRYEGQRAELKALKNEAPFLREVPHHILQEALVDLDAAFDRFFRRISNYPRPREKFQNDSFRFPDPKQIRVEPSGDRKWALLRLPKMGKSKGDHGALRIRLHRPVEGDLRSVTVALEGDHCYVSILVAQHVAEPVAPTGPAVGVDRGVAVPLMRSDGVAPRVYVPTPRQEERKRRLGRALSRAKRGSRNRAKARRALARHEAARARRLRHTLHQASKALARDHAVVRIEALNVRAMTASARGTAEEPGVNVAQKSGLNRAILARGWGIFGRMLGYKCPWNGSVLQKVPVPGTSQTCPECWVRDPASRASRDLFRCTSCGHERHADWAAAIVIRGREDAPAVQSVVADCPENTGPDPACGDLCAPPWGGGMSVKQETAAVRPGSPALQGVA